MVQPDSKLSHFIHVIHRNFIWLVVASYFIAAIAPQLGLWIRSASLGSFAIGGSSLEFSLPSFMLASLLFNAGLGVKPSELKHLFKQPFLLISGLIANLLVPLAFIAVASQVMRAWHNHEEVQQILVGLALVASMPIAGSSTAWSQNANGSLALSLGLVLFSTLVSPLLTPLGLHFVGFLATGDYSSDLHEIANGGVGAFLGVWVILPSVLGIIVRCSISDTRAASIQPTLKIVNWGVLLLLNYANAALSLPKTIAQPDADYLSLMLVLALSLCTIAYIAGWLIARIFSVEKAQQASMMFALGMNNNGTGLVLAGVALADHPEVMLPIIFYNLVQHLVAASVDAIFFRERQDNTSGEQLAKCDVYPDNLPQAATLEE